MGTGECNAGGNLAMDQLAIRGGGGSRRFMLQKPGQALA